MAYSSWFLKNKWLEYHLFGKTIGHFALVTQTQHHYANENRINLALIADYYCPDWWIAVVYIQTEDEDLTSYRALPGVAILSTNI